MGSEGEVRRGTGSSFHHWGVRVEKLCDPFGRVGYHFSFSDEGYFRYLLHYLRFLLKLP
uniref:Uncharacterized protein n=1 Tax=Anguilla anguilla TaxID=7936 RepID=A0A0E9UCU5_ANGAN